MRALAAMILAIAGLAACADPQPARPAPPVSLTLPPHPDSARSFDVTVYPRSGPAGTVVFVTTTEPTCIEQPDSVSVAFPDLELQGEGRAESGTRVPHNLTGRTLNAIYTVAADDSRGNRLFIVTCGGADGLAVFEVL